MSTLSSSSTYAEIVAGYFDGASYEEDVDVAKCRLFITATRMLIRMPKRASTGNNSGGQEYEFDQATLSKELDTARTWLAAHAEVTGTNTVYADFSGFRD